MAGEDPIIAVSKVFADLADEGGAAADSLATINSILTTSLNRTMLRFGRAMNDSVKSIQAFNVGLKTASKRVSTTVTQKQAARMGAASQASEAIHRTKVIVQERQQNKQLQTQDIENAFDDLASVIRTPLIVAIEKAGGSLMNLFNLIANVSQAFLAFKGLNVATKTKESFDMVFDESHKTANQIKQAYTNLGKDIQVFDIKKVSKSEPVSMSGKQQRIAAVQSEYATQRNIAQFRIDQAYAEIIKTTNAFSTLNLTTEEQAQLMEGMNASVRKLINAENMMAGFDASELNAIRKAQITTVGDIGDKLAAGAGKFKTSIVGFIAGLKASTVILTGSFAAAIAFVTYKMYDFGKNAIPRLYNYLLKPLQTVYEFVSGPLNQAFSKVTSFVSVLNPAYGEQANRALDDLSAVIGRILLPVFNAMLSSLKVFTSFLSINADRLKGTMQALGNVIANIGAVVIANFFRLLGQAQPIFEQLTAAFQRAIPIINNSLVKLFKEVQKYIPTFIQAINALGMMLEMYLKQKLQEFANQAALASKAAQNQARAMELFGDEAMTLSMAFNNLGYYVKDLMLELEALIIEIMSWTNWFTGRPQAGGIIGGVEFAGGENPQELNAGEKAGAAVRKWIAGLFGAEDVPWAKKPPKPQPEAGAGQFDINRMDGADFGEGANVALEEGFAGKGAAFQEIGQLGKNLAAASFGMGPSVEDQQLNVQQQILQGVNGMLQNQNQFNGNVPVQGVR